MKIAVLAASPLPWTFVDEPTNCENKDKQKIAVAAKKVFVYFVFMLMPRRLLSLLILIYLQSHIAQNKPHGAMQSTASATINARDVLVSCVEFLKKIASDGWVGEQSSRYF